MTDWRQRALSFGTQAELYDRRRPTYPDVAADHVLGLARATGPADVMVEVGCGTGKATAVFDRRAPSLRITGVEPDAAMADVARRHVPHAEITVSKFEEWDAPSHLVGAVDVVASAQAWHWVDHAVGIPKAVGLLRPGGVLAVLANVPLRGGHNLRDALDPVYDRHLPGLAQTTAPLNWDGQFEQHEAEFREVPELHVAERWHLDWDQPLAAAEFGELLRTHSDYIALPTPTVDALVADVQTAIDEHGGGTIVMHYRTVVLPAIRR